jgi:hypothetical protein
MSNPKPYDKVEVHSVSESIHLLETFNYMVTTKRYLVASTRDELHEWLNEHCKYNWYIVNNFPDKNMVVYMFRFSEDALAFKLRFNV